MAEERYTVTANKSAYFSSSFETAEEAVQVAAQLVNEGYTMVSIRDIDNEGDIW